MTDDLTPVGRIVRLQVQTDHLKRGEQPRRWYDPAPITQVDVLRLESVGVTGIGADGTILHDVHHRDHRLSRFRGDNGISVGFTGHYETMRDRFGSHLTDGIAGENILVESGGRYSEDELGGQLLVETANGSVRIDRVIVAAPCVEFTKFCLQWPRDRQPDRTVTEALQFLDDGMRGFYGSFEPNGNDSAEVRVGDMVYRVSGQPDQTS